MNIDVDPNQNFEEAVQAPAQTQKETVKVEQKKTEGKEIQASQGGLLIGSTAQEQMQIAAAYHNSGLMPRGLDSPQKVLVAMQLCHELHLPVVSSIGKVMVVNGTPSIFGDLPLGLVRRSGLLISIKEELLKAQNGDVTGARCTVVRKGEPDPIVREFTVEDAKRASLWMKTGYQGKPTPWVLYPNRMLQMRARSWALKDGFPDVLSGVAIGEYDHNAALNEKGEIVVENETETLSATQKLNALAAQEPVVLPAEEKK